MSLKDEEIELLREQNKLLKMQLELYEKEADMKTSKKKNDVSEEKQEKKTTGLIILFMFIIFIVCVLVVLLVKNNIVENSSEEQSGECVQWEKTYNDYMCKYDSWQRNHDCRVTGEKCIKWK